jgi:hypothetical protein
MAVVGLLCLEPTSLVGHVIRSTCVEVPGNIDRIRRCVTSSAVIATSRTLLSDGGLFLVAAPIVADAEKIPLEATVAARGIVPVDATQLAVDVWAAAAIGSHRWATGRGRRRGLATRSTSCGRASRRARWAIATWSTTTIGGMGVGVVQLHRGMAGVNALLGGEKARVQVPLGRGRLTTPHRLNQVVVVLVEAPKDRVSASDLILLK